MGTVMDESGKRSDHIEVDLFRSQTGDGTLYGITANGQDYQGRYNLNRMEPGSIS